jgi:sugar/nucleoside kinase (ribokinase family)
LTKKDFGQIKVAIFSPGTGISTRNHMLELKKNNSEAMVIFDPSQVLSIFYNETLLKECLSMTDIFIGNETEVSQLKTIFGLTIDDLIKMGIKAIVETRGEEGSIIFEKSGKTKIEAVKPSRLVETTGAGDAFRSGFIYGLLNNMTLAQSCKIGAFMGAKNVEEFGGQMYKTNIEEFKNLKFRK